MTMTMPVCTGFETPAEVVQRLAERLKAALDDPSSWGAAVPETAADTPDASTALAILHAPFCAFGLVEAVGVFVSRFGASPEFVRFEHVKAAPHFLHDSLRWNVATDHDHAHAMAATALKLAMVEDADDDEPEAEPEAEPSAPARIYSSAPGCVAF
jgi:hypothetical protein